MPFTILRQDITKLPVDAMVNAANTGLAMGGGVCGAIFQAAGAEQMQEACRKAAPVPTGKAAVTPGFALPARYVIHAVGPVYHGNEASRCEALLRSAYWSSLELAVEYRCASVAFPLISSGIYGYPKEAALRVAVETIREFLRHHDLDIYLAVFDKESFVVSRQMLGDVEAYLSENYVARHTPPQRFLNRFESQVTSVPDLASRACGSVPDNLEEIIGNLDEPFNATLLRLIDARGKTDVEVYKKANIDRKLFSKIRTGKGYMPGKRTVLALAVALELSLPETDALLEKAGYALSHSIKADVIVEYFVLRKEYDIYAINEVLFHYDQPLLGSN